MHTDAKDVGFHGDPVDSAKVELVIQMLRHLRETRTSLWRASRRVGISRRELKSVLACSWAHKSVAEMQSMANAICQLPIRRFALVSRHLEHWRTPPAIDAQRDAATRQALQRYFSEHSEEPGNAAALRFLESM